MHFKGIQSFKMSLIFHFYQVNLVISCFFYNSFFSFLEFIDEKLHVVISYSLRNFFHICSDDVFQFYSFLFVFSNFFAVAKIWFVAVDSSKNQLFYLFICCWLSYCYIFIWFVSVFIFIQSLLMWIESYIIVLFWSLNWMSNF